MRRCLAFALIVTFVVADSCFGAEKLNSAPPSAGPFDGTWEGVVKLEKTARADAAEERTRFVVTGPNVHVYVEQKGAWSELKPAKFQISFLNTNAVIWASNSGYGLDTDWTDTAVYAVTVRGDGILLVEYTSIGRSNNELDGSVSVGSLRGKGEFKNTVGQ